MNQPELGKKIVELRKAKGFTQEELVEKCNLSVRTLQRIESGEVTPRSYTIKIIFAALEYHAPLEDVHNKFGKNELVFSKWFEQVYIYVIDLFNLKTHKMRKISILSITLGVFFLGLFALCSDSKAQKSAKAIKAIEASQIKINKWINSGQIDSILTMYSDNACDLPNMACNKTELHEALKSLVEAGCQIVEFNNLSINVCDTIAVQKYYNVAKLGDAIYKAHGLTEWHLIQGKWLIVNDVWVNH